MIRSKFWLGVLAGTGVRDAGHTDMPRAIGDVNKVPEELRSYVIEHYCDHTNGRFYRPYNFTMDEYNESISDVVKKALDSSGKREVSEFVAGYLNSSGKMVNGLLQVTITSNHIKAIFDKIALPFFDPTPDSNWYGYIGCAAQDLLNVASLYTPYESTLASMELETARINLNINRSMSDTSLLVTKLSEKAVMPFKARASDAGYDLTAISLRNQEDEVFYFGTGIAVQPPFGYYMDVVPRSSIAKSGYALANSVGIIDPTYSGEIVIALRRVVPDATPIDLPSRIAQMIPRQIIHLDLIEAKEASATVRGSGGFGSSGK